MTQRQADEFQSLAPPPTDLAGLDTLSVSPGAPPPPQPVGPRVPGYDILEELGRGGMGVVYKARQTGLKRVVALKMILSGAHAGKEELARFRREAEAVARLQHPNIVQIYEIGEHAGLPYFSLEFVEGGTLATLLQQKRLTPREAAEWIEALARAAHYAHERGIVHRDLKPANVLLGIEDCRLQIADCPETPSQSAICNLQSAICKIADFGLAKKLDDNTHVTSSGQVMGTPSYMAPEQALGQTRAVGPGTDIYALGSMLYHFLTGAPPFVGESSWQVISKVMSEDPAPPRTRNPDVPRALEAVCLRCLEKSPERRYPTASALADDLRRFLNNEVVQARSPHPARRALRGLKRLPLAAAAAVLLVVGLLTVGAVWFGGRGKQTEAAHAVPTDQSDGAIRLAAAEARGTLFRRLVAARTADGWMRTSLDPDDAVETEVASHSQTLHALLSSPDVANDDLTPFLASLEKPFEVGQRIEVGGIHFGWRARSDRPYTTADPALWTATALATALARPNLLHGERRERVEKYLHETQQILETYHPANGGWNLFPRQTNPGQHNNYTHALALLCLLETRKAGGVWLGDRARLDKLLGETVEVLLYRFDATAAHPGWHYSGNTPDKVVEGLSLQIYATLLRAEAEAGVALPPAVWAAIRPRLSNFRERTLDYPPVQGEVTREFLPHMGERQIGRMSTVFLWYPWATECAVRWLESAKKHGASPEEVTEVHAVLGHLVVDLGPDAAKQAVEGYAYVAAERLRCLSTVPVP